MDDPAVRSVLGARQGYVFRADARTIMAAFATATLACDAAVEIMRRAGARYAIALHVGAAEFDGTTYRGASVQYAERMAVAAHGGQVLVSLDAHALLQTNSPVGTTLRDIGRLRVGARPQAEQFYQLVISGLPADFPPLKIAATRRTNLPVLTTPFFGRTDEVREGCRLLRQASPRLLTLTGAGGVGKTRLGIEIASSLLDDFEHGVYWVSLAAVTDASGVLPTIARVLGVSEEGTTLLLDIVSDFLHDREMLLVLDNFEQVVEASTMLKDLLAAAPRLKLLVTSRAILRLDDEHEFGVAPLALPVERHGVATHGGELAHTKALETLMNYPAVALFVARAQAARSDWVLTVENAATVAAICVRLDGLPLAIELAAARIRLLSPQELLERLQHRLTILTGGARDLLPHQRTLRGTIAWSYDLLDLPERTLFGRLAVFAGGWTIRGAEAVCDEGINVLDGLQLLLDESLIQHERSPRDPAQTHLLMLDTIREYAHERLVEQGELAAMRQRHAQYFALLAETTREELSRHDSHQATLLERLDSDDDNLRAALAWGREADDGGVTLARLAGSLWRYWELRGRFTEGRAWLEQALVRCDDLSNAKESLYLPATIAQVVDGAGVLADYQGDYSRAEELYQRGLVAWEALNDQRGVARALNGLGGIASVRGAWTEARGYYERSLALRRTLGDRSDEATTLNNLALVAFDQEQFEEAQRFFEASLQIARSVGDERGIARGLANVGLAAMYRGERVEAETLLESSLAMYRSLGEPSGIAHLLGNLGNVALANDDNERAHTLYVESLALFQSIEDRNGIAESLEGIARAATARREYERAARLWAAAGVLRRSINAPLPTAERDVVEHSIATAREQLGDLRFQLAWRAGEEGQLAATIAYARATSIEAPRGDDTPAPTECIERTKATSGRFERT